MNVIFYLSYDIKIILKSYFWRENVRVFAICVTLKLSFHNISRNSVNHLWFIDFNAWRYSLSEETSYDKLDSTILFSDL